MEGRDGQTERATPKKRKKEREKGNICISPEVVSMVALLVGVLSLRFWATLGPVWWRIEMIGHELRVIENHCCSTT